MSAPKHLTLQLADELDTKANALCFSLRQQADALRSLHFENLCLRKMLEADERVSLRDRLNQVSAQRAHALVALKRILTAANASTNDAATLDLIADAAIDAIAKATGVEA